MDGNAIFTIADAVKWMGKKQNHNAMGINSRLIQALYWLSERHYIDFLEDPKGKQVVFVRVNNNALYHNRINSRVMKYAIIYLDELDKLTSYHDQKRNESCRFESILKTLVWLRIVICRRKNEDNNIERYPEIAYSYLNRMGSELGMSEKMVSNTVAALEEMKIIYVKHAEKYKVGNKWKYGTTLFCNYYKRDGKTLIAYGKDYYDAEIKAGERMLEDRIQKGIEYNEDIEITK